MKISNISIGVLRLEERKRTKVGRRDQGLHELLKAVQKVEKEKTVRTCFLRSEVNWCQFPREGDDYSLKEPR